MKNTIIKNSVKTLLFSAVLISFIALSCSSEDEPGAPLVRDGGPFEISELTGSWEATKAEFFRVTDGMWVDVVGEGGSLSLTVTSSGRCTFIIIRLIVSHTRKVEKCSGVAMKVMWL